MSANIAEQGMVSEAAVVAPLFVINLCASTSPMALTHPSTPELKRFTFFVTRQREDGRERFRLHMGYFPTQNDAEAMLSKVRDIYPAAWAGPAPSTPAALRRTRPEGVPVIAPPPVAAPPVVEAPPVVAAPAALPAAVVAPPAPAPVAAAPAAPSAPASPPKSADVPTLDAMSNVRDVLARLSDSTPSAAPPPPVAAPAAPAPRAASPAPPPAQKAPVAAEKVSAPAVKPAAPALTSAPPVAAPPVAAPKASAPPASLTAAQTLDVLEFSMAPASAPRKPEGKFRPFGEESEDGQVRVVTPEDTQTLTDIRLDAQTNAPPCFAVQLVWSVTPIDITKQAHLAIFDAYTLYNVEGNRQGRRWYGLRLGFFSDPNSATQVAYYVRSDYPKVAVVPVASRERERANGGNASAGKARLGEQAAPLKPETQTAIEKQGLDGFELLKDDRPIQPKRDVGDSPQSAAKTTARAAIAAAMARTGPLQPAARPGAPKATGKRVATRSRSNGFKKSYAPGQSAPLESTLEILGASTLTIDESREIINDSAIRAPTPVTRKSDSATGRFARLLGRLGGG